MSDESKWVKLVAKLNAMTQDGKLEWTGPIVMKNDNGRIFTDYIAKYKDKAFRVRKASGSVISKTKSGFEVTTPMDSAYFLAVLNQNENTVLYPVPGVVGISDLYESVVYQLAGIKELIDDILNEE